MTPASGGEPTHLKRFNFPSAPSEHVRHPSQQPQQQPQQQPYEPQFEQRQQQPQAPPRRHAQQPPQPQPPEYGQQPPAPRIQPVQPAPARPEPGVGGRSEQQPLVRPYAMTGGRTRPRYQLAIEALVHTTADSARLQGQLPEQQRICRLCYEIKSVAEISALLTIPLGVARILVADLAEAGLVAIHQPGGDATTSDGQPDVTLLERVLSGLRKL
nr:DUF742 domain-containing protein [Streptomyces sp. HNM0574]